jgi:hypothetical protein
MGIVTGTIKDPLKQPIPNSKITFRLSLGVSNPSGQFLAVEKLAVTNSVGFFTIGLEPGIYQVTYLESRETFKIVLPDDGTYDISELRPNPTLELITNPTQIVSSVIAGYISAHNLDPLAHPDGIAGSGGGNVTEYNFAWGDATPDKLFTLPANHKIILISVNVAVAFNLLGILSIGTLSSPELIFPVSASNLQAVGQYEIYPAFSNTSDLDIYISLGVSFGTTQGRGSILFEII